MPKIEGVRSHRRCRPLETCASSGYPRFWTLSPQSNDQSSIVSEYEVRMKPVFANVSICSRISWKCVWGHHGTSKMYATKYQSRSFFPLQPPLQPSLQIHGCDSITLHDALTLSQDKPGWPSSTATVDAALSVLHPQHRSRSRQS